MLLDPPLKPGVLAHMGSFQAAMQIVKPLDDDAWELLKPRLISQRSDAEQRESERLAQIRVVLQQQNTANQDMQVIKSASDSKDQEWDDVLQAPLRARIGGYADETIRDGWAGGQKVSKDNCSVFAAQVLIYIRSDSMQRWPKTKQQSVQLAVSRRWILLMDPSLGSLHWKI